MAIKEQTDRLGSDKPLICFFVTGLNYGGAETVVIKLVSCLRNRGWPIKIISMLEVGPRISELQTYDIEIASLKMRRGVPNPMAIFKLAAILRKWRPTILHSHMVHANLLGRIARIFVDIPIIISTAHNINEGARWREYAYRITDSLADMTTNVSMAAVERYIKIGAVPSSRIRYVANGIDTEKFKPDLELRKLVRKELDVENVFTWLAVGRLDVAKDYPNMLQAFVRLPSSSESMLLIAGQGPEMEKLTKIVNTIGLENRVRFLGLRTDIANLMKAADAFVLSSAWEGLPMVLLEAAATGLPIVATNVGGNREIVLDHQNGYTVDPKNAMQLSEAMQRMMELSNIERRQMGEKSLQHIKKNYELAHIVDVWEELYAELLKQKRK